MRFPHQVLSLRRSRDFFLRGILLLVLACAAGEEDETGPESLEAFDVQGEGFDGKIGAAGVDADADRGGKFAGDTCFLFAQR